MIFISHDLTAVEKLCDRVLILRRGQAAAMGAPHEMIARYSRELLAGADESTPAHEDDPFDCESVTFSADAPGDQVRTGDHVRCRISYVARQRVRNATFALVFWWPSGYICTQFSTGLGGRRLDLEPGPGAIEFECPVLALQPGLYRVDLSIEGGDKVLHRRDSCAFLRVMPGIVTLGDFYMQHSWKLLPGGPPQP
jgi:hypothetical protein